MVATATGWREQRLNLASRRRRDHHQLIVRAHYEQQLIVCCNSYRMIVACPPCCRQAVECSDIATDLRLYGKCRTEGGELHDGREVELHQRPNDIRRVIWAEKRPRS
jgi:hypothetical protein